MLEKQIVRLLLDAAMEVRMARSFVTGLQGPVTAGMRTCAEGSQPGRPSRRESGLLQRGVEDLVRNNPQQAAAVITKWMSDGR